MFGLLAADTPKLAKIKKKSNGRCRQADREYFGQSPGYNVGEKYWADNNCESRCDNSDTCSGYSLRVDDSIGCYTYTSYEAKGDGNSKFQCTMKRKGK